MTALHNRPGIRAHAAKYNVDAGARKRLRVALQTLETHREAVNLALRETGDVEDRPDARMRSALELLVEGPNGEFR